MLTKIKDFLFGAAAFIFSIVAAVFLFKKHKMDKITSETEENERKLLDKEEKVHSKIEETKKELDKLEKEGVADLSDKEIEDYWKKELGE